MDVVTLTIPLGMIAEDFELLWQKASAQSSYRRQDSSKRWTLKEKKECVRYYAIEMLHKMAVREK